MVASTFDIDKQKQGPQACQQIRSNFPSLRQLLFFYTVVDSFLGRHLSDLDNWPENPAKTNQLAALAHLATNKGDLCFSNGP